MSLDTSPIGSSGAPGDAVISASYHDSPVLVEPPPGLFTDVLGPDGLEGAESTGGLDVADHTAANHGRALNDGNGLNNLLLVDLGTRTLSLADDVGHAGLVAEEAGQMNGLGSVVLGEGLDTSTVGAGTLLGVEAHGAMAGSGKLTVRLEEEKQTFNLRHIIKQKIKNVSLKLEPVKLITLRDFRMNLELQRPLI